MTVTEQGQIWLLDGNTKVTEILRPPKLEEKKQYIVKYLG